MLVRRPRGSSTSGGGGGLARLAEAQLELCPIDHGFCLPEGLEPPYFEWLHWPQVSGQTILLSLFCFCSTLTLCHALRKTVISSSCRCILCPASREVVTQAAETSSFVSIIAPVIRLKATEGGPPGINSVPCDPIPQLIANLALAVAGFRVRLIRRA